MSNPKIIKVELRNIMKFDEYTFDLTKGINVVSGKNGEGKTTLIKAIEGTLEGGAGVRSLLKEGEKSGEIVLYLEDGGFVQRKIKQSGTSIHLYDKFHEEQPKASTKLKQMIDPHGMNPAHFLLASNKDRINQLTDLLVCGHEDSKLDLQLKDIRELEPNEVLNKKSPNVFNDMDRWEGEAMSLRKVFKRSLTDKKAVIKSLEETTAGVDTDINSIEIEEIEAKKDIDRYHEEKSSKIEEISVDTQNRKQDVSKQFNAKEEKLREIIEKAKNELQIIESEKSQRYHEIEMDDADKRSEISESYRDKLEKRKIELNEIQTKKRQFDQYQGTIKNIAIQKAQFDEAHNGHEISEKAIQAIREERKRLMGEKLPKGLTIEDGDLYYNGISFETLNTQQQVDVAARLSLMRSKGKGLIFIDGFEALDSENSKLLLNKLAKTDIQLVVTKVSDEPLNIERYEPEAEPAS